MSVTEKAISWMEALAADDSHGYDQAYRWGEKGDYDCSSAVITAFITAGIPLTCTYTGNMYADMIIHGFNDVTDGIDMATGEGLRRGDVLLNVRNHVAMYCGGGKEVEASQNEFGGDTGGQPGDQTGREILVRSYRNYPWDYALRYADSNDTGGEIVMNFGVPQIKIGDQGDAVYFWQNLLRGREWTNLALDGSFGAATEKATKAFQKRLGLTQDGVVGPATWSAMIPL